MEKGSPYGVYFNKKFYVFQMRVQMWQGLLEKTNKSDPCTVLFSVLKNKHSHFINKNCFSKQQKSPTDKTFCLVHDILIKLTSQLSTINYDCWKKNIKIYAVCLTRNKVSSFPHSNFNLFSCCNKRKEKKVKMMFFREKKVYD